MPPRITADRVRSIQVDMDLRVPRRWSGPATAALVELLAIMGNVEWSFSFGKRRTGATRLDEMEDTSPTEASRLDPRRLTGTVLFSGGLDSTSGLATLRETATKTVLVSYYTGNLTRQQEIAKRLGFPHLMQIQAPWSREGGATVGGQLWYRSFLYLTLAAVVAESLGISVLKQFENGPLAFAIPPAPIYRMTRHAHPAMHRAAERLFESILGREIRIENPFLLSTKREAVAHLRRAVTTAREFDELIAQTETCWNLKARRIVGKAAKRIGAPCGACIPCIVRHAALGTDDVPAAVDFARGKGRWTTDPCVRVHLEACLAFANRLLSRRDPGWLLTDMPVVTESVIASGRAGVSFAEVADLYLRFAKELRETYP
jgi:7-cyano-7-deazaguanine synthase in queuosine biosynthesis